MATQKQKAANRENAKHSTGPTSQAGLEVSAWLANWRHGLAVKDHQSFEFLLKEKREKFDELLQHLNDEHKPSGETEVLLVRHMAQSEWLRARALRLQNELLQDSGKSVEPAKLAVFIRYETTHTRNFHRSLKQLLTLRQKRHNLEIGFESQKLKQAAEVRASEGLNLKKEAQILQREAFELKKFVIQTKKGATQTVQTGPVGQEMAA